MAEKRRVTASGSVRIKDDEIFSDDFGTLNVTNVTVVSTEQPSSKLVNSSMCVGGEVRLELEIDADIVPDGDVRIHGAARLFEGTDCNTNDLEDTQNINLVIPKDGTNAVEIKVESTGAGGGDYGKGKITFYNISQPLP